MSIRDARDDDAGDIAAIYAPIVEETTISFELEAPSASEMLARIQRVRASAKPWLVAELDGRLVAYSYAGRYRERPAYRWSVESSICVSRDCRGRGIGRELYAALLRALAESGIRSVYAAIARPNPASERLHKALGFEMIGTFRDAGFKHGAWRDVDWWQRQLGDGRAPSGGT